MWYNKDVPKGTAQRESARTKPEKMKEVLTMNAREFFNGVIAICEGYDTEDAENAKVADEVLAYAQAGLLKLDEKNEKRRNTPSKTQKENEPLKVAILGYATGKTDMLASEVGAALEMTTSKASALLRILVDEGRMTVRDVKVKGKGAVKAYTPVADSDEE